MINRAIQQIKDQHKLKLAPYTDQDDVLRIGYGKKVNLIEISPELAQYWLELDLESIELDLSDRDFFKHLNVARKAVIINIAYALGLKKLLSFKSFIHSLKKSDFESAAGCFDRMKLKELMGVGVTRGLSRQLKNGEWK